MGGERRGDVAAGQGAPQPLPFGLVLPVGLAAAVDVDDQALEAVPVGDEGVRIGACCWWRPLCPWPSWVTVCACSS